MKAWKLALTSALLALALTSCGSSDDDKKCELTGNGRTFGQCCTDNAQCGSNVCYTFGDGTQACTLNCTTSDECPEGSQGKKCNQEKVCRV